MPDCPVLLLLVELQSEEIQSKSACMFAKFESQAPKW
jgi:hypothetical protein